MFRFAFYHLQLRERERRKEGRKEGREERRKGGREEGRKRKGRRKKEGRKEEKTITSILLLKISIEEAMHFISDI